LQLFNASFTFSFNTRISETGLEPKIGCRYIVDRYNGRLNLIAILNSIRLYSHAKEIIHNHHFFNYYLYYHVQYDILFLTVTIASLI